MNLYSRVPQIQSSGIVWLKHILGGGMPPDPLIWSCFIAALGVVSAPPPNSSCAYYTMCYERT